MFICKSLVLLNVVIGLMGHCRPNFSPKLEPMHRTTGIRNSHPPRHPTPQNTHPPGTLIPLEHPSPWNSHPPGTLIPPGYICLCIYTHIGLPSQHELPRFIEISFFSMCKMYYFKELWNLRLTLLICSNNYQVLLK